MLNNLFHLQSGSVCPASGDHAGRRFALPLRLCETVRPRLMSPEPGGIPSSQWESPYKASQGANEHASKIGLFHMGPLWGQRLYAAIAVFVPHQHREPKMCVAGCSILPGQTEGHGGGDATFAMLGKCSAPESPIPRPRVFAALFH